MLAFAEFGQHVVVPKALVKKHHFDASEAYEGMSKEKIRGNLAQSISHMPATEQVVDNQQRSAKGFPSRGKHVQDCSLSMGFLYFNLLMRPCMPVRRRWLLHHGCWRSSVRP